MIVNAGVSGFELFCYGRFRIGVCLLLLFEWCCGCLLIDVWLLIVAYCVELVNIWFAEWVLLACLFAILFGFTTVFWFVGL